MIGTEHNLSHKAAKGIATSTKRDTAFSKISPFSSIKGLVKSAGNSQRGQKQHSLLVTKNETKNTSKPTSVQSWIQDSLFIDLNPGDK